MPARINQLATSLEMIILKYYGPRPTAMTGAIATDVQADTAAAEAGEYLQVEMAALSMEEHIQERASKKSGCDRAPLMMYLAHGLGLIKTCLDNPKPLDDAAIATLKQALTQLLVDLKSLQVLPQAGQIIVRYNDMDVMIKGCCGCASGNLIQEAFPSLLKQTPEDIAEYITDTINEHQNALLVTVLTQENTRLTQAMSSQANVFQDQILQQNHEIETLKNTLAVRARKALSEKQRARTAAATSKSESTSGRYSLFKSVEEFFSDQNNVAVSSNAPVSKERTNSANAFNLSEFNPY